MMKKLYLLLIILAGVYLLPVSAYGTNDDVTLGAVNNDQTSLLKINIESNGQYSIYRYISGNWARQFYANPYPGQRSHLFAIKIGNTLYSSGGTSVSMAGAFTVTPTPFTTIEDVGTAINTGIQQEMTKKFSATYDGHPFSVTLKILYNTSNPDYLIKVATVDASQIPQGTDISLAYGWDTFVNTSDAGYALIVPDIFGLNDWHNPDTGGVQYQNRYLTTEQVQSLRLVGARNESGNGALIGFFPIGRKFDRGFSASPYNPGYCFNMLYLKPGDGTANGNYSTQYCFQFGPYSSGNDNGTGVAYDNITAGQVTEIKTGLTFTTALDGELDYTWNGQKNLTANIGDNVNLKLDYQSYNIASMSNVGFRVDFTGLKIRSGGCTSSGFSGGSSSCVAGNEYYQISNTGVDALGAASVSVPVNIVRAGQWVVDGNSISDMSQTLPLGSPATLTVATTVSLADGVATNGCNGSTKQFTVKFPGSVIAAQDVVVNLTYSGATSAYATLPTSVTIPEGSNSATFDITPLSNAPDNSTLNISLSSTNQVFATIAAPSSVQLTNYPTPQADAMKNITLCSGAQQSTIHITGTHVNEATSTWTNNNTAIGLGASGTGAIPSFTAATNSSNTSIAATITVTPKSTAGCSGSTVSFTITIPPKEMYWKQNASNSNWNDPANWTNAAGAALNAVPAACNDVHIPGTATNYPSLDITSTPRTTNYGNPVCNDIYFHFGGEMAKPHLLSAYNKAFVEYNFGYFNGSTYKTDGDAHSATPMKRGQWYALATPLNKMTPGDFSFGGKPDVWQKAFVRNNSGGTFAGEWETPHNKNATDVTASQYSGIAIWMANVVNGSTGEDPSYHTNLNDLKGCIWMPFFEDATTSGKHRIHQYTGGQSRFFYYENTDPAQPVSTMYDAIIRGNEAYKFIFEGKTSSVYINSESGSYPTYKVTVPAGKEIMVGNPFLSTLDFDKFYQINQSNLLNATYRLYVNTSWAQQYTVGSGGALTKYIAPLQAFFIQTKGSGNIDLLFPPDLVSTTSPANKLKASDNEYDDVLYINAANNEGSSWVTLGMKDGVNVDQLFNNDEMYANVPQIYVADQSSKNAVQFFSEDHGNEIAIGIQSKSEGKITLRFENIEHFNTGSLVLTDKVSGDTYDLLRAVSEITFTNIPETPDRFTLQVGQQTSGTRANVKDSGIQLFMNGDKLNVIASDNIDRITVTNTQGVTVLNIPFVNKRSVVTGMNVPDGIYIVHVTLVNGESKTGKILVNP